MIHQGENSIGIGKLYGRNESTDTWVEITDFSNLTLIFSLQDANKKEVAKLQYLIDDSHNIAIMIPNSITKDIVGQFYLEVILKDNDTQEIIVANTLGQITIAQSTGGKKYGISI